MLTWQNILETPCFFTHLLFPSQLFFYLVKGSNYLLLYFEVNKSVTYFMLKCLLYYLCAVVDKKKLLM